MDESENYSLKPNSDNKYIDMHTFIDNNFYFEYFHITHTFVLYNYANKFVYYSIGSVFSLLTINNCSFPALINLYILEE